jgi:hypothetical protein
MKAIINQSDLTPGSDFNPQILRASGTSVNRPNLTTDKKNAIDVNF